jgi:heme/copper-type cytochrome/quinol oxidase subunit 2
MTRDKKESAFPILAVIGLAALLVAVLWAGKRVVVSERSAETAPGQRSGDVGTRKLGGVPWEKLRPSGELRDGVRVVDFEAFRYGFAPDPLVVREGKRVRLRMKSRDVEHGATILAIGFSAVVPAGAVREAEFDAPGQPGAYAIYCNVYCGPGHGNMRGTMVVLPAEPESRDR